MRAFVASCLAAAFVLAPGSAAGQDALALFKQGRTLVEAGNWAAACPLFAAAHRLNKEAVGITMNLADCYAHVGKTGSAWSAYVEAEYLARKANESERVQYAHDHAAALEPRVSKLTLKAPPAPGLKIRHDDVEVDPAVVGVPLPVDPGEHRIEVTAPGRRPWSTVVRIDRDGARAVVEIPPLEPGDGSGPDQGGAATRRAVGFAALGVGGAGLVAGAVALGLDAAKHNSLLSQCPGGSCPARLQPTLQGDVDSYHTLGAVATTSLIAGGALAATGAILVLTAPRAATTGAGAWPVVGAGYVGLGGRFF